MMHRIAAALAGLLSPNLRQTLVSSTSCATAPQRVMEITAAVVREKFGAFTIEKVVLTDPRPDEALVRIVASGMCQTDLHGRDGYYNMPYPAVYGHEGAGVVEAVGTGVKKFAPGDHVVISLRKSAARIHPPARRLPHARENDGRTDD